MNSEFASTFDQHDEVLMAEALLLAKRAAQENEVPIGAVIVREGEIIGRGWNQNIALNDPSAHAEIMAIRKACAAVDNFTLNGSVIYASSEPCPMCLSAIYWARIDELYFACSADDTSDAGFDDSFI